VAAVGSRVHRLPVAVALVIVVAGCAGAPVSETGTPYSGAGPLPTDTVNVTVTDVVDGDTVEIEYANGTEDTVRLVGVDTPEVRGTTDPTEFEGVSDTDAGRDCLRSAGDDAARFATDALLGEAVGIAVDPETDRRDRYDRLLAYVVADDQLFNYRLVASGHARVYDQSPFSRKIRFLDAERRARQNRRGLWRCVDPDSVTPNPTATASDTAFEIVEINADAAGNDNENLNDEYIVFTNRGDGPLNLSGWTVSDAAGHSYTFENGTLDAGEQIALHTGNGTDTQRHRYWGATTAIWGNDGDTVVVRNADGAVVIERSY